MFDRIAAVYDPMNLVISAFQEPRWRRQAVALAAVRPGDRVLDVATGTGKVAADLRDRVDPGGRVLGVDISPRMIAIARHRFADHGGLDFLVGDALALPTEDASFDAATMAFGMRNLPDYRRGFAELARSVRPGGRVVCLEIARPRSRPARLLQVWFDRIVPLLGRLAGQGPPTATSFGAFAAIRRRSGSPRSCSRRGSSTSAGGASRAGSSRSTSARSRADEADHSDKPAGGRGHVSNVGRTPRGRSAVPCPPMPEPSSEPLIRARRLTKRFGSFTAVDAVDFDVARGESFGFLGPERRREDVDDADDRCGLAGHRGHAPSDGHGPRHPRTADPRPGRRRAPAGHARQRADRAREPRDLRSLLRAGPRGDRPARRRTA